MTLEQAILKALSEVTLIETDIICSKIKTTEVISARQIGYYLYKRVYKSTTPGQKKSLYNKKQRIGGLTTSIHKQETYFNNGKTLEI